MGLRDLLKKKDDLGGEGSSATNAETLGQLNGPEFKFIRSDTHTQEIIHPPADPRTSSSSFLSANDNTGGGAASRARLSLDVFRPSASAARSRGSSVSSTQSNKTSLGATAAGAGSMPRRLSQRLHLSREPATSGYVPENLPSISVNSAEAAPGPGASAVPGGDAVERQWENRATMLAHANDEQRRRSFAPSVASPGIEITEPNMMARPAGSGTQSPGQRSRAGTVSSKAIDEDIQEAIRLHEAGDLEQSTKLFGRLAEPQGANNPLSQVLYGLALRHGWGCEEDLERAVSYLSAAASNSAAIEEMALKAGLKKGGAAKGELVLAIFELANCFRHGWGIPKDAVAAKQYYETAANLGDTDAMNEIAWCYLEGYGCKKDKYTAARYYRMAEENGNKTLGNTWIWKDKYSPGGKK